MLQRGRIIAWSRRAAQSLLAADAWIDSAVFATLAALREGYERLAALSDRLRVRGLSRLVVELSCEALTLGAAGAVLALALALPAFQETDHDLLKKTYLAI